MDKIKKLIAFITVNKYYWLLVLLVFLPFNVYKAFTDESLRYWWIFSSVMYLPYLIYTFKRIWVSKKDYPEEK